MSFHGFIDYGQQSHIVGWAADDNRPVPVIIEVHGERHTVPEPTVPRPDLVAALGLPLVSGWAFTFPEPLSGDEVVRVYFPDGTELTGSPYSRHQVRLRQLLDGIDLEKPGLEFGPLDHPILSKKRANVFYVDHASRDDLLKKYTGQPIGNVNPAAVREVDIVWPSGSLAEHIPGGARFAYAIASHVIEHVPDMIGWLAQISSALQPNGILSLAIPFKHATFDWRRTPTEIAAFVGAHIEGRTRPTAAQIFDHIAFTSELHVDKPLLLREALAHARAVEQSKDYIDVHCTVFTPESFLTVMAMIATMGLTDFGLRKLFPPEPDRNEFVVSLQRQDATFDARAATYEAARAALSIAQPA